MHFMRFLLLASVIGFGVYAQVTAKRLVTHTKERNKRVSHHQKRMTTLDTGFVARAMAVSQYALEYGYNIPAGSVVVMKNEVIGEGWDRALRGGDPTAHAEIEAVRAASKYINALTLEGSILYTTRRPCEMCLGVLQEVGIKAIYYANVTDRKVIDTYESKRHKSRSRSIPEIPVYIGAEASWINGNLPIPNE